MALLNNSELLIKIGADVKGAIGGIDNVRDKVGGLGDAARAASSGDIGGLIDSFSATAAAGGPATIAVTAVTAAVAAYGAILVTATATAFEFAKQASEFGSKIYDASVQTGLGAEALSALNAAAAQSDVEFSKVVTGINKFSLLVGEAGEGSDAAAAKLARFGLTASQASNDLEGSLSKVIRTIDGLPPGVERANAAAAAFGAKGGKEMLKLIDQMDGDLPGLIAKMKSLGLTIDDEAARAADNFGDKLTILGMRFDMAKNKIGLEVMPAFERFFNFLDAKLAESGADIESWAKRIGNVFMGLEVVIERVINFFTSNRFGSAMATLSKYLVVPLQVLSILEKLGAGVQRPATPTPDPDPEPDPDLEGGGGGGGGGGAGDAKAKADKKRQEALEYIRLVYQRLQREVQAQVDAWNENFSAQFQDGVLVYPSREDIEADIDNAILAINEGYADLSENLIQQKDTELSNLELSEQARANIILRYREIFLKLERDREEAIRKIRVKAQLGAAEDRERAMQRELADQDRKDKIALEAIERERNFEAVKVRKRTEIHVARLRLELSFLNELAEIEKTDIKRHEDYLKRIEQIKQKIDELNASMPDSGTPGSPTQPAEPSGFFAGFGEALGDSSMVDEVNGKLEAMRGLGNLLGETFKQVAQGLGTLIQQWVLTGEVGPKAMRKLTASILAGLAAQAAVEALMELARGFKELALGNPVSAALHFKAAAIFGVVAGTSAVAGRAVAGDSFRNESSRASGQGESTSSRTTSAQGQAYSSQEGTTVNASMGGVSLLPTAEIVIKDASGMFSQLFETEIRNNSRVRRLIIDTANS